MCSMHKTPLSVRGIGSSNRTEKDEVYRLLAYTHDVDLNEKLAQWQCFYNYDRPHGAFNGKTPYEALRSMRK